MNKKAFTITELLAVIAIVAILSIAAMSGYSAMANNSKKKMLEQKVSQIELAAEKYAKEQNINSNVTISINKLILMGYLQPDSTNSDGMALLSNPVNNDNLVCNLVTIRINNDNYKATFVEGTKDCNLAREEIIDDNVAIKVVKFHSSEKRIIERINNSNEYNWVNDDVLINVNSEAYEKNARSITYEYGGNTITKNIVDANKAKNPSTESNYKDTNYNELLINNFGLIFNSPVNISYNMKDGQVKTVKINIKIDKEPPTGYYVSSGDTSADSRKVVNLYFDDGSGSGVKGYYYSLEENNFTKFVDEDNPSKKDGVIDATYTDNAGVLKVPRNVYYIKIYDRVGNYSKVTPIEVSNFDPNEIACTIDVVDTGGTSIERTLHWYNSDIVLKAESANPTGDYGAKYNFLKNKEKLVESDLQLHVTPNEKMYSEIKESAEMNLTDYAAGLKGNSTKNNKLVYCHNIAGIDKTKPKATITASDTTTWKKQHNVTITITDNRSGFVANDGDKLVIKYGWSNSNTESPTTWNSTSASLSNGDKKAEITLTEGSGLTGRYYLWLLGSAIKDKAENYLDNTVSTMEFYFDNTDPTCTESGDSTDWAASRSLGYGCYDEHSNCNPSFSGGSILFNTKTVVTKEFDAYTIKDNAGNITQCPKKTRNVYVDKTKPTCVLKVTAGTKDGKLYTSDSITIGFDSRKDTHSGVQSYGIGTSENYNGGTTEEYKTSSVGTKITYGYVKDKVGNVGQCSFVACNKQQKQSGSNKTCTNGDCCGTSTSYSGTCKCYHILVSGYSTFGCKKASYNAGCNSWCKSNVNNSSSGSGSCSRNVKAKTCTKACCGIKWGSWKDAKSCSSGTYTKCRRVYYTGSDICGVTPTVVFTASFDSNNGGESSTDIGDSEGTNLEESCSTSGTSCDINLINNPYSRTNYDFVGWNTKANATTGSNPGKKVTLTKDVIYYAIWEVQKITRKISFNANGGSGTMNDATCSTPKEVSSNDGEEEVVDTEAACTIKLPKNTFTRTGYNFKGWGEDKTPSNSNEILFDEASIYVSSNKTLYAQWDPKTITVTYNTNNGKACNPGSKNVIYASTYGDLCTPKRTGYSFTGWYTAKTGGTNVSSSTKVTKSENHTIYANWKANIFTVAYNANGGSGTTSSHTCTYDAACSLAANGFKKSHATFVGWKKENTGKTIQPGTSIMNATTSGTLTYYAQWSCNTGYTLDASGKCSPNTFTIVYNGNGNTGGATSSHTCTYDAACSLAANGFTKEGFKFTGWKKENNGSALAAGASIKNVSSTNGATITYYAQWEADIVCLSKSTKVIFVIDSSSTMGTTEYGTNAYKDIKKLINQIQTSCNNRITFDFYTYARHCGKLKYSDRTTMPDKDKDKWCTGCSKKPEGSCYSSSSGGDGKNIGTEDRINKSLKSNYADWVKSADQVYVFILGDEMGSIPEDDRYCKNNAANCPNLFCVGYGSKKAAGSMVNKFCQSKNTYNRAKDGNTWTTVFYEKILKHEI